MALPQEKSKAYKRVWNRSHRKPCKQDPQKRNDWQADYRRRHPDRVKARKAVFVALRAGKLHKPKLCARCNKQRPLQADHSDYTKPLDVIWYCRLCHIQLEIERRDRSRLVYIAPRTYSRNEDALKPAC